MLEEFERQENENKRAQEELKNTKSKKEVIILEQYPLLYYFYLFLKLYAFTIPFIIFGRHCKNAS